jgi:hypothetical protein
MPSDCTLTRKVSLNTITRSYCKLRQLVAKIQAKHSGYGASAAMSDKAGGLDAVLFLSTKAEVLLTCNL